MAVKAGFFLFILFCVIFGQLAFADDLLTFRDSNSVTYLQLKNQKIQKLFVKSQNELFVQDLIASKWSYYKRSSNQIIGLHSNQVTITFSRQNASEMFFGGEVNEGHAECEPTGISKQTRAIASVIIAPITSQNNCSDQKIPKQLTDKFKPEVLTCIQSRIDLANGLFTTNDIAILFNELNSQQIDQILECTDTVESFASSILPTRIKVNEARAAAMTSLERMEALSHEVTHLLVQQGCLNQQRQSCGPAYDEGLIDSISLKLVKKCLEQGDGFNFTATYLASNAEAIQGDLEKLEGRGMLAAIAAKAKNEREIRQQTETLEQALPDLQRGPASIMNFRLATMGQKLMGTARAYFKESFARANLRFDSPVYQSTVSNAGMNSGPSAALPVVTSSPLALSQVSKATPDSKQGSDPKRAQAAKAQPSSSGKSGSAGLVVPMNRSGALRTGGGASEMAQKQSSDAPDRQPTQAPLSPESLSPQEGDRFIQAIIGKSEKELVQLSASTVFINRLTESKINIQINAQKMIGVPSAAAT